MIKEVIRLFNEVQLKWKVQYLFLIRIKLYLLFNQLFLIMFKLVLKCKQIFFLYIFIDNVFTLNWDLY